MTTRILAFTPAHPDYGMKPQTVASIEDALEAYDGPVDWMISSGDNPHERAFDNVVYQHNKARQFALDNGYDALLSIEADMIVPPDAIGRLIDCDADIAYGLYVWRHKLARWSAYTTVGLWVWPDHRITVNVPTYNVHIGPLCKSIVLGVHCKQPVVAHHASKVFIWTYAHCPKVVGVFVNNPTVLAIVQTKANPIQYSPPYQRAAHAQAIHVYYLSP